MMRHYWQVRNSCEYSSMAIRNSSVTIFLLSSIEMVIRTYHWHIVKNTTVFTANSATAVGWFYIQALQTSLIGQVSEISRHPVGRC